MDLAQYRARVLDSYALVTYIPGPLGTFLDELSQQLVPGSKARSHVTLLPPRHLKGTLEESAQVLDEEIRRIPPFELQIGDIQIFDITSVIYADILHGRSRLLDIHRQLNRGPLEFKEQFAYHPHVTLAIDAPQNAIPALMEEASERWAGYSHSKRFTVETVNFVHNVGIKNWEEIGVYELNGLVEAR